jgi:hypothetical protein
MRVDLWTHYRQKPETRTSDGASGLAALEGFYGTGELHDRV